MQHEDLMIFDPTAVKGTGKVFGNDFPIHLEIGMGKWFFVEQAMRNLMSTLLNREIRKRIVFR